MLIKLVIVLLLGVPAGAVLLFEVILNATAMFNHGNVYLPEKADQLLRWFLVTPAMHWVHHSIYREETDSNFGFNLPWCNTARHSQCYGETPSVPSLSMGSITSSVSARPIQ